MYSAKRWRWKTLANLANRSEFAKVLPTKVLPSITPKLIIVVRESIQRSIGLCKMNA